MVINQILSVLVIVIIFAGLFYFSYWYNARTQKKYQEEKDKENKIYDEAYNELMSKAREYNSIQEIAPFLNYLDAIPYSKLRYNDFMKVYAYTVGKRDILNYMQNNSIGNQTN